MYMYSKSTNGICVIIFKVNAYNRIDLKCYNVVFSYLTNHIHDVWENQKRQSKTRYLSAAS